MLNEENNLLHRSITTVKKHSNKWIDNTKTRKHVARSKVAQNIKTVNKVKADVIQKKVLEYEGYGVPEDHHGESIVSYGSNGDHSPSRNTVHLWKQVAKNSKRQSSAKASINAQAVHHP